MSEQQFIGLDVDRRHINMVKLVKEAASLRIADFACIGLNPQRDREEKVRQLNSVAKEKGIESLPVNLGVSGETVIVRYLDFPKMKEADLSRALQYEAQQYIPFKMEEVVFDYHVLSPSGFLGDRMKVLLVAAKKQVIIELVGFIRQAGLKSNLIDVNAFSLINCFLYNGPEVKDSQISALINLKFNLVNINILHGKTPFFTRDISFMDDQLMPPDKQRDQEGLFTALKPHLENLIREIRLSLDYFESEFEKQVKVIYFSGEGAKNTTLINLFTTELEKEIKPWNPLEKIPVDSSLVDAEALAESAPMLALACGLALRGTK